MNTDTIRWLGVGNDTEICRAVHSRRTAISALVRRPQMAMHPILLSQLGRPTRKGAIAS